MEKANRVAVRILEFSPKCCRKPLGGGEGGADGIGRVRDGWTLCWAEMGWGRASVAGRPGLGTGVRWGLIQGPR